MAIILTTLGELDDAELERKDGVIDTDHEHTTWVEYYCDGALVHRSVHVTLKQWPAGLGALVGAMGE